MTVSVGTLSLSWDEFDAYLFDIDGTLIHCTDAVHYFAFCEVLSKVAGRSLNLDNVVAHGNTDVGILRDAFTLAGVPEELWRSQIPAIRNSMCDFVDRRRDDLCVTTLPKVREVLEHLRSRGATLGVATGNLETIGKRKLETAGLLEFFQIRGWSDAFEYRSDVFRAAVKKVRDVAGVDATILAIGDTPADVQAAKANGLPVVAVATGIYPFEELQGHQPDLCIHSFEELLVST
jgi:phosphoglycolate phosphatase